jgi:hypothetical protein
MILYYIDPGTGSIIISFLISIFSSILFFFRKKLFGYSNSTSHFSTNQISIFSEGNQYKSTFIPIVNTLIKEKINFNYFTLDYEDDILNYDNEYINPIFLGIGIIGHTKFSSISSKILISTTPNIGTKNYPLKKPKSVKELAHVFHMISDISYYRIGSLDNYDTVFTVGEFQHQSIKEVEKIRSLKTKKLVPVGLPYFDYFKENLPKLKTENKKKTILLASSWGSKGLIKKYGTSILNYLKEYTLIIRPHPQSFKSELEFILDFKSKCLKFDNIIWDEDILPLNSFSLADILISDTSSIRFDFAFLTNKPVLTLKIERVEMKDFEVSYLNSKWDDISEIKLGQVMEEKNIHQINHVINETLNSFDISLIKKLKNDALHSDGNSSKNIVEYIKTKLA